VNSCHVLKFLVVVDRHAFVTRIVDDPTVAKEVLDVFGSSFANEPERRHFAEYLTGLILAPKKNVSAINREFAETTDPSCLNRWLGKQPRLGHERRKRLPSPVLGVIGRDSPSQHITGMARTRRLVHGRHIEGDACGAGAGW
jgi:hypothetical protein